MIIHCPKCNEPMNVDRSMIGNKVKCLLGCGFEFVVEDWDAKRRQIEAQRTELEMKLAGDAALAADAAQTADPNPAAAPEVFRPSALSQLFGALGILQLITGFVFITLLFMDTAYIFAAVGMVAGGLAAFGFEAALNSSGEAAFNTRQLLKKQ